MSNFKIKPVGFVSTEKGVFKIILDKEYIPALTSIEGFSHLHIFGTVKGFMKTFEKSKIVL